jgi:death on curing protein
MRSGRVSRLVSQGGCAPPVRVTNDSLIDGNKRLGWLSTAVFLELNGIAIHRASNDDVDELVMAIAEGARTIGDISDGLRALVR